MRIVLYKRPNGACPVKESLEELERERPDEHRAVLGKLRIIRELTFEECLQAGHIKSVRGKIWSAKMGGHQSRVLGFRAGDAFMAAHLTIKKQDELDERDIRIAEERREEWNERQGT